ncbi:Uncharacterized conserved protein, contains LGFP repeats [Geodermatophilus telluris]|uniref:Uncharacterized conserved protein, contains LGFP repeats n=1 Tax=Geodermatophilus telluris TaxID=1190417 RepID=A0A1G6IHS2_9ACTN|nr:hypothetical protein [Geodermatophilus telluris]SDC05991.1 Uncharacterized conserved protein, contains LGFP repeats [Geodermatophilus telluris]
MRRPRRLRLLTSAGLLALVAVLLTGLLSGDDRLEEAADLSQFRAGDIISDAIFFDGWSMPVPDVQRFLDQKGAACRTGTDGTPCLRVYRQDTPDRAADAFCGFYDGQAQETAAAIIGKVGQACGINPRVLLVTLQKEQSLVTNSGGSNLYARRYREAMGFACPDTAPCNPAYNGFFNQVYSAAHRFKEYAARPINYFPGRWNTVLYNPNRDCGSSSVFIYNQATAGLYTYTPYQPNAAALRAGYGTGDACSTYGNRNFFSYYTDWFGSTHEPGAAAISDAYYRAGPDVLGSPATTVQCGLVAGGCYQIFARGAIYWTPATGAHVLRGALYDAWAARGRENGPLGYPVTDEGATGRPGGAYQLFTGGRIYWTAGTGAQPVRGGMLAAWDREGRDNGVLGFPASDERPVGDGIGTLQEFEGGTIFYTDTTGAAPVRGAIRARWQATGGGTGPLGYPTTPEQPASDRSGSLQRFERGVVAYSDATGAQPVRGAVLPTWEKAGGATGPLGYPTGPEAAGPVAGGVVQAFQRGTVHWSASTGGHPVTGPVATGWDERGGAAGPLGLPTSDVRSLAGDAGVAQDFQGGSLYALTSGTVQVRGAVLARYQALGGEGGALGLPTSEEVPEGSAQVQRFQRGLVHWSADGGARVVRGALYTGWLAAGGLTGPLGAPVADETAAGPGAAQRFSSGTLYWSAATGAQVVRGEIARAYTAARGPDGPLGMPVAGETAAGPATVQQFQSGAIWWTAAGGAHPVRGGIATGWEAAGGLTGALGAPVGDETAAGNGAAQRFANGDVYWSAATGPQAVLGDLARAYADNRGPAGPLGFPVAPERTVGAVREQRFQSGGIWWTTAGGAHPVRGGIGSAWEATGGPTGPLGAPVGDETAAGAGASQRFANGAIHWSATTGSQVVRGEIAQAYDAAGGPAGPLGFPVAAEATSGAVRAQRFQSGGIWWTTAGGAHPVRGAIGAAWEAGGGPTGPLGAPVGDETAVGAGASQRFANGTVYWSATTGSQPVRGDVGQAYLAAGGPAGPLGFPTGAEAPAGTGRGQRFQSGGVWWTSAGGAHVVRGAIGAHWEATGGMTGPLGAPLGDEGPAATGAAQRFGTATLYWSATTGPRRTTDVILDAYVRSAAQLGDPLGDVYPSDGGRRVDFTHGWVLERNGVATVTVG